MHRHFRNFVLLFGNLCLPKIIASVEWRQTFNDIYWVSLNEIKGDEKLLSNIMLCTQQRIEINVMVFHNIILLTKTHPITTISRKSGNKLHLIDPKLYVGSQRQFSVVWTSPFYFVPFGWIRIPFEWINHTQSVWKKNVRNWEWIRFDVKKKIALKKHELRFFFSSENWIEDNSNVN